MSDKAESAVPPDGDLAPKNMFFRLVQNCMIAVHNNRTPTEAEWDEYLEACVESFKFNKEVVFLVITEGGAPSPAQRMRMNDRAAAVLAKDARKMKGAIVTDSTFVRGVVTAMGWFRPVFKAFPRIEDALRYLEVSPHHFEEVRRVATALKLQMKALLRR